ncbi:MAG: helix-turn-helix domain protein [Actinomycetia bacterium]|jgi:transcriptional regulator with XRE-family HTH domain|nr:helix-turn-helix domain protein [Actinomycetes bacterium]
MSTAKSQHVTPLSVARALRVLGTHVSNWRKLNRLTAAQVAERAGISRDTLRAIEQGKGTASTENLMRVLRTIGIMDAVVKSADPYETDVGRLRMDETLPKRVRD